MTGSAGTAIELYCSKGMKFKIEGTHDSSRQLTTADDLPPLEEVEDAADEASKMEDVD